MAFWSILPPQLAHDLAPLALSTLRAFTTPVRGAEVNPLHWKGLRFRNRLGVAGGVDKSARQSLAWQHLGAGFVEVGTVTPRPQGPNPGKILDRSFEHQLLWNRMGFPNPGAAAVHRRLQGVRRSQRLKIPVFLNIGKNRDTELAQASQDYLALLQHLHELADAFVINVSSPNTQGLRALQGPEELGRLLQQSVAPYRASHPDPRPLLLKLAPDLSEEELALTLQAGCDEGVDGFILTNTTRQRPTPDRYPAEGGFSGGCLVHLSRRALSVAASYRQRSGRQFLIVSTGGILSPEEVHVRFSLGADLIQTYSALVLKGPYFFRDCLVSS